MNKYHYLGFRRIVGNALYYVATFNDQWVALLGWGSAALKCAPRDKWIGWDHSFQYKRLHLIANNTRFLILPGWHLPNLASRILALNIKRLSGDWEHYHGNPVLLAETFVDCSRFHGTCYLAAGWEKIGITRGFSKNNRGYSANYSPKFIFVRPLIKHAQALLRTPFLSQEAFNRKEAKPMIDVNALPLEGEGGLIEILKDIPDPRKPRGVRHSAQTILAIAICAALSGARSFCAIAEWAQSLTPEQLRKLGSNRRTPPSEPTIRRLLQQISPSAIDQMVGQWLLDKCLLPGQGIAIDGKTLRRAHDWGERPPQLLSAILQQEAIVIGQVTIEEKTNEIPKIKDLLDPMNIEGTVITADALHTQKETARYIVEDKKADYLFIVKDNQAGLRQDIKDLFDLDGFSPSA